MWVHLTLCLGLVGMGCLGSVSVGGVFIVISSSFLGDYYRGRKGVCVLYV